MAEVSSFIGKTSDRNGSTPSSGGYQHSMLFVLGGEEPVKKHWGAKKTVEYCHRNTDSGDTTAPRGWRFASRMHEERSRLKAITIGTPGDEKIIALGGSTLKGPLLSSCEFFDPVRNEWFLDYLPPMSYKRENHGAVSLPELNAVVVTGGDAFGTCELLDLRENKWQALPSTAKNRKHHGMTACNGILYVGGGLFSSDTVECYDLRMGRKWDFLLPWAHARKDVTLDALNNKIYAVGGWSMDGSFVNSVDIYDPEEQRWYAHPSSMTCNRAGHASVVVDDSLYVFFGHELSSSQNGEVLSTQSNAYWSMFPYLTNERRQMAAACSISTNQLHPDLLLFEPFSRPQYDPALDRTLPPRYGEYADSVNGHSRVVDNRELPPPYGAVTQSRVA